MRNSIISKLMENNIVNRLSKKRRMTMQEKRKSLYENEPKQSRRSVRFKEIIDNVNEKENKTSPNIINNLKLEEDHKLSLEYQNISKNEEINPEIQNKFRNKFQEIAFSKQSGKDLEEDDIIFIKAAKKEFDPFNSTDESKADQLKEKMDNGEIVKDEIELMNFINLDNQFEPIENIQALKSNAANINPSK